jgi:NAD(P)-dependent dehydrogenase (short-subunit alcohol dehydrogenase family)
MLARIPAGRFGTVEENAALIAWIVSREKFIFHGRRIRYIRRKIYVLI